jgi:hypothetical protein
MEQIPKKKSILQLLFEGRMSLDNSCPMNPTIPLDLRDFFICKSYGYLMDWWTPVDLGYDVLDLGYDVMNLGYNVIDKIRGYVKEDQDKFQEGYFKVTW